MTVNEQADGDLDVDIWSAVWASISIKHTANVIDTELHFQNKYHSESYQ